MYEGYAEFGGIEVVNNRRAYLLAKGAGLGWIVGPDAAELDDAIPTTDFSDPTTAPWYDADLAEVSSRFYGVYGLGVKSPYDSTRSVPVTQNSGDGGVMGVSRKGTREMQWSASLLATGADALEYGRAWLASILELGDCEQGADCDRADTLFFSVLPASPSDVSASTRYLKYATTTSGPFTVNEGVARGVYNQAVEWTWTSERPFIYYPTQGVDLTLATALALVQDSPINWAPFPSAELEEDAGGYSRPTLATNVDTNPSVEPGTTNWAGAAATVSGTSPAAYLTTGSESEFSALGTKGFLAKIAGNGSTSVSTSVSTLSVTKTIDITGVTSGRLLDLAMVAVALILAGSSSALGALTVTAQFQNSGSVNQGSPVSLVASSAGRNLWAKRRVAIPATSTKVLITASVSATWTSGNADATNSDVRLYADASVAAYVRSV